MTSALVSLQNVSQSYSGRTVLSVDSLGIMPGTIIGLAGPNGSGKSTLLRLLAFLEPPASGEVLFLGRPASTRPSVVHRDVTLLVQEPYLLKRSVFANIAFGLKVRSKNDIPAKVNRAMGLVGLAPEMFAKRQWFELSGGECQRVALAARLVLKPKMLLMDEPTASLDETSSRLVREAALFARNEHGTGLVTASHDMAWLRDVSDCILHMKDGRIVDRECRTPGIDTGDT